MLFVRKATAEDLDRIMDIYASAREFMKRTGNPNQWGSSYPPKELIREDIRRGICRAVCDETGIHGVFALLEEADPSYGHIENGKWPDDDPYVTIHRIAGDGSVRGVFACAVSYCKKLAKNVRIDTHAENKVMQRHIESNGFAKCGIIYLANGSPRIAYQWSVSPAEDKRDIKHIEEFVKRTAIIGKTVKVIIDRPLGSRHPEYDDLVYPVNYGYAEGVPGGDGEEQDVYVLGADGPLTEFEGKVIAVYHRFNDDEDKWIVAADGKDRADEEILKEIEFTEKFFKGELIRK